MVERTNDRGRERCDLPIDLIERPVQPSHDLRQRQANDEEADAAQQHTNPTPTSKTTAQSKPELKYAPPRAR